MQLSQGQQLGAGWSSLMWGCACCWSAHEQLAVQQHGKHEVVVVSVCVMQRFVATRTQVL
jgi:hypothetical protein